MAEENIKKVDITAISDAASAIKDLKEQIELCDKQMKEMSEGTVSMADGILNIAIVAGDAFEDFKKLSNLFQKLGESWKKILTAKLLNPLVNL